MYSRSFFTALTLALTLGACAFESLPQQTQRHNGYGHQHGASAPLAPPPVGNAPGAPAGFVGRLDDPAKAAQCEPPKQLVRTDVCRREGQYSIKCKLDCK